MALRYEVEVPWQRGLPPASVPGIIIIIVKIVMENQMEKKMENEMETGII